MNRQLEHVFNFASGAMHGDKTMIRKYLKDPYGARIALDKASLDWMYALNAANWLLKDIHDPRLAQGTESGVRGGIRTERRNGANASSSGDDRNQDPASRPKAQTLSDNAAMCIQILESSMGQPRNRDITARDLDSMLADYVDDDEDSVELIRSVRDGSE